MMKFEKVILGQLEKCYGVAALETGGRTAVAFGSEDRQPGVIIRLWMADRYGTEYFPTPGGVMSILPWPSGGFASIYGFYPPFQAARAGLMLTVPGKARGYESRVLLELPYLHRFEIIGSENRKWLVLSVLCRDKQSKDDWSSPGYVAVLPLGEDGSIPKEPPYIILDGQYRNHGMWKGKLNGSNVILTASDQGVFACCPSDTCQGWKVRRLTQDPAGEAAAFDLDDDGIEELVTIAPFHGSKLNVYKNEKRWDKWAEWTKIWTSSQEMDFLHALWVGNFHGKNVIFCGNRKGKRCLRAFWQEEGEWISQVVDKDAGSSNICVAWINGQQCLLSANHGQHECALYRLTTGKV